MKINRQHFTFAAICAATVFLPTSAFAGDIYYRRVYSPPPNIVRSVSRQESRDIQQIQVRLQAAKRRALRDGRISRQEREEINDLERELNRAIRSARRY
ncbi:hypothetical protein [Brasilonema sp. UFV-L1]|uniref:hypothetical protein n=1 Tax=Brasilonema sp. UFV-L1 TaxID=2234130 RepID=UPI00145EF9A5|nr:hypothetical protein [Brasilonema sp. UFV-L1]